MPVLVASDLHIGSQLGVDVVRHASVRARLLAEAERAREVVLLGDVLELRQLPLADVLAAARPFFSELGEAVAGGRVTLVPGNHDHRLAAPLLERRRLRPPARPLALEQSAKAASGPLAQLAKLMPGVELTLAYPGVWVRPGVYATHGHYLDVHTTVPRLEVLAVGAVRRIVGAPPEEGAAPDDYERVLGPVYAFAFELAQAAGPGRAPAGAGASARVWSALNAGGRGRRRALRAHALTHLGIPLTVAGLNRAGLGPLTPDLSGPALHRAGLDAIGEVVRRLGVGARHVIFGHTHRTGPLPGEREWVAPGGARLLNTGSWLYEPALVGEAAPRHPYWPGGCARVPDDGPPELVRLLADADHAELRA